MLTLIAVPYHLGEKETAVGAGPSRVLDTGIASRIEASETRIDVGPRVSWQDVNTAITSTVQAARAANRFPLIIAGNCNSCLGTLAALEDLKPGIVWFDAHGDFHTEQTSLSGSLEGMSLALATAQFVPENRVVLAGGFDLDPGEVERVRERLLHLPSADLRAAALPVMGHVYVHLDIDVIHPRGLTVGQLGDALAETFSRFDVAALAITNYNPAHDAHNHTRDIIIDLIEMIARLRRTAASR